MESLEQRKLCLVITPAVAPQVPVTISTATKAARVIPSPESNSVLTVEQVFADGVYIRDTSASPVVGPTCSILQRGG